MGTASHDGWEFYKVATFVHNRARTRQGLSVVNVLSVRLRCGQSIIWVQLTLEVKESGSNEKRTYGKVRIKVERIVSNSYSRAEKCVLLLQSQRPTVCIDFVRDEIWLVIACYTFAHQHLHMKWKLLGWERTSGLKEEGKSAIWMETNTMQA